MLLGRTQRRKEKYLRTLQLARYFHLDETDLAFISNRRGDKLSWCRKTCVFRYSNCPTGGW
ncbi:DUF4158 domain-containing protein [Nitrosomonas eutropha]|uniref:DUF4158 domain-containing protein n=1 Tax=Nitrosomonas eutropha TaxID=916 RepID=UPI0035A0A446